MNVPVACIFEFDGDKLLCEKVYFDMATLMNQLTGEQQQQQGLLLNDSIDDLPMGTVSNIPRKNKTLTCHICGENFPD